MNDSEKYVEEYKSIIPEYELFIAGMKNLVSQLVKKEDVVTIEARVKTADSFKEKIEREGKNYQDPLKQITDLAGIRIITYRLSDIETVKKVIEDNFTIDSSNSEDKTKRKDPDKFGYLSVHYVITHSTEREKLPEYSNFVSFKCEVQIRTVLQHAWAAIDHKLRYKSKDDIPEELLRPLYRMRALLEVADEQFEASFKHITEVREKYNTSVESNSFKDIPLDIESLSAYVKNSPHIKSLRLAAEQKDLNITKSSPNCKTQEYSRLLYIMKLAEIESIAEFDGLIGELLDKKDDIWSKINEEWKIGKSDENLRLVITEDNVMSIIFFIALNNSDKATKIFFRTWHKKFASQECS